MKLPADVEVRNIMGNAIRVDAAPVRFSTAVTYVTDPNSLLDPTLTALEKLRATGRLFAVYRFSPDDRFEHLDVFDLARINCQWIVGQYDKIRQFIDGD